MARKVVWAHSVEEDLDVAVETFFLNRTEIKFLQIPDTLFHIRF